MNVPANVQNAVAANKPNGATVAAQPSYAELLARIAQLEKEQAAAPKAGTLSMMVSAKGAIQINGFGRFPFTPYREQAEKLGVQIFGLTVEQFQQSPIGRFIAENDAKLSRKADSKEKK